MVPKSGGIHTAGRQPCWDLTTFCEVLEIGIRALGTEAT